jgi:hypothetical protein
MQLRTILGIILCILFVLLGIICLLRKRAGNKISTNDGNDGIYENGIIPKKYFPEYYPWDKLCNTYHFDDKLNFFTYTFIQKNCKNNKAEINVEINKDDKDKVNNLLYKKGISHINQHSY